jgi:hypothetical protein
MPSILDKVQLPDWDDSERLLYPPRPVSLGVLVAESMAPAYHPGDRWHELQGARRAEQEAANARTAQWYESQQKLQKLKEERDEQERRAQRSG